MILFLQCPQSAPRLFCCQRSCELHAKTQSSLSSTRSQPASQHGHVTAEFWHWSTLRWYDNEPSILSQRIQLGRFNSFWEPFKFQCFPWKKCNYYWYQRRPSFSCVVFLFSFLICFILCFHSKTFSLKLKELPILPAFFLDINKTSETFLRVNFPHGKIQKQQK